MSKKDLSIERLFGIPFVSASKEEVLDICTHIVEEKSPSKTSFVFTPNPEQMVLSFRSVAFKKILQRADWNLPDGQGIVWALGRQKAMEGQVIKGREVFHDLLAIAGKRGWRVFLLGGRSGSAGVVASKYQTTETEAHFYFDEGAKDIVHETKEEETRVIEKINKAKPQVLFIAYGAPWQEQWLLAHQDELTSLGVRLGMVVGGAFDYEAGLVPPVPKAIERLHLEWLWRLCTEPWRWRRQLAGLSFFWHVIVGS